MPEETPMEEDLMPSEDHVVTQKATIMNAPTLSKSWAIESAHVPIFMGGKICPLYLQQQQDNSHKIPCMILPVNGDLAIVHAERGTKMGSVRESEFSQQNNADDEDDEDGLDGDAITAFALSANQETLVTCTHSHLLHQYEIKLSSEDNTGTATGTDLKEMEGGNDNNMTETEKRNQEARKKVTVTLQKTWGKSGHSLPVTAMEFHRSGVFVATASVDGTCRIFDVRGGHVTHIYRPVAGGSGGGSGRLSVTCIKWMDDNTNLVIAIGRDDGSIVIHDLRDKDMKRVVQLRDHMSAVTSIDWWWKHDKRTHAQITTLNSEQGKSSSFYPYMLVTAGRDAVVNLWQISDNNSTTTPNKGKGKKKKSKKQSKEMEGAPVYQRAHTMPLYEQIEGMVVLPQSPQDDNDTDNENTMTVATAGSNGAVRLWVSKESTPDGEMSSLTLLAEQQSSEAYGKARGGYLGLHYMDMPTTSLDAQGDWSESATKHQLVVADAEHCISFLSLDDTDSLEHNNLPTERRIVGFNDDILDLKMIPPLPGSGDSEPSQIVVATNSAQVRIFALDTFSCHILDGHTATVLCVDVSPCGRYIATSGKDNRMCLWHTETRKCIATAVGHTEAVGATALSRKKGMYDVGGKAAKNGGGAFAVTVSLDRTLKKWNLPGSSDLDKCAMSNDAQEIALEAAFSSRAHEKDINVVSVAPNDSLIATGSQDKCAKLWRSTDLSPVATLRGHRRGVWDCQFSQFDRVVATASGDRSIRLWSLSDYSCVRTFQGHVASVLRVRFLNGGLQLMTSGADGLVKLWTIRTNECEATMDGHSDKVWALDVAPIGNTMISGGADSQLLVWNDTTRITEDAKRAEREESYLMDQRLANHLRHKEFAQALDIALTLDKPRLTLKVLTSIIETELKEKRSPVKCLQQYVPTWSMERIIQILQYCRDWNTRARNCDVAMIVIRAVVSVLPADELGANDSLGTVLAGVTPYAERHFDRLDGLLSSSYLLDFALFSMGSLDDPTDSEFSNWEAQSKLVLPPVYVDGKTQVGGQVITAGRKDDDSDGDVSIVGDSDSSDDDDDDEDDGSEKEGAMVADSDSDSDESNPKKATNKSGSSQSSTSSSSEDSD